VLRQTSPDDLSVAEFPFYIYQTRDISCLSPQCIPANKQTNKQTSSYRLTANRGTVGITSNLQRYAAGCILSRTCKLTVIHSLVTCSLLYIPQDFPLFVIIFLTFSTTASHGSTNTSARFESIRIEPNGGRFIQCSPGRDTIATQTPVSPPRRCNCSHRKYGPGRTFKKST
jgi:hypothetical protein